uniref:Reverse transcriptase domain-containing protein n=1 Tax=Tanacetum cinerariifolium TaxID=118510 RepID=A0A699HDI5_TANCI|nr:reverse transcriptase domain-containing protein [Tanacetum cinerariifolium]
MIFNIDLKHSYSNDDTCLSIDVIDKILKEDFDALLEEGCKILHSIEGTLLEEEIFSEFDELMAMTADENSKSESNTDELKHQAYENSRLYKGKQQLSVEGFDNTQIIHVFGGVIVGNKMHKAFPLPGESSHWQYKFPLPVKDVPNARRLEIPLPGVYTAIEEMMKKLPVKDRWQLH